MTITVLLAPDGSRVWAAFGKHDLDSVTSLMEAMSAGNRPYGAAFIADLSAAFDGYCDMLERAPGYRVEHHDLAELLAGRSADRDLHEAAENIHDDLTKGRTPDLLDVCELGRALEAAAAADSTGGEE